MKTVSLSEFRNHPQGVLERLRRTRESVVLTKRGKPVARMFPYGQGGKPMPLGALRHRLIRIGDIVSPLDATEWEVLGEDSSTR